MLIVQKYGGTSLADPEKILAAARRALDLAGQGARVVMVVSAQGHTTDHLVRLSEKIDPDASPREKDACLAVGEQLSAALTAMAVEALGGSAVSLTGWQAGILTDSAHTDAEICHIDTRRILRELDRGRIVVVAGFQGVDPRGNITTLGRGGSDTTAVALAAALSADRCQIFTDVDGVYDRDPRRCSHAVRFDRIGYDAMLELIRGGAQVLHRRCVELARDRGIPLEVGSAFTGAPGTLVGSGEVLALLE